MEAECPVCEKCFKDLLKHISLAHNVRNMDELSLIAIKKDAENKKRQEFIELVRELNAKIAKGEISGADFRELTQKWREDYDRKKDSK